MIHRDLKPSNIKVKEDGCVKVLDFGLAKAVGEDGATSDPSASPTITAMGTATGVIVGSAAYMSPEQAKGKAVDRRTDVWAFGCVLYEMLTGQRAFAADSVSETLVAVMTTEIDLDRLPGETPPRLRRVLVTCLQKDPTKRVRDIGDVRLAMEGAFETVTSPTDAVRDPQRAVWRRAVPWMAGVLLAMLTGLGGVGSHASRAATRGPLRDDARRHEAPEGAGRWGVRGPVSRRRTSRLCDGRR